MAVSIDGELLNAKEKLSSGTGKVTEICNTITSKLEEINSCSKTAVTNLSSNYQGDGLSKAVGAFTSIEAAVEGIKSSLAEGPLKAVSLANDLVSMVGELETLLETIEALEAEISRLSSAASSDNMADRVNSRKADAKRAELKEKETEFKQKHEKAKAILDELKALNPTIDIAVKEQQVAVDTGTGEVRAELQNLKEGTYNKVVYTSKSGRTITTYIYLPKGANSTTGLPISFYMGGDGSTGRGLQGGVGYEIRKGAQYSGIVCILQADNDKDYSDGSYLDAAKEFSDNVVKTYNCDANRISISGYSYGGSGVQHMLERFPGYFAQAVILGQGVGAIGRESGGDKNAAYAKLAKTKIHIICGTNDSPNYGELSRLYSTLKAMGADVTCEWRRGVNHDDINAQDQIVVNGVTYDNYVEFCLAQSKSDKKA